MTSEILPNGYRVRHAERCDDETKIRQDGEILFCGTLKYLYLLFATPETLRFDDVIFNTEAHQIRKTWKE